MKRFAIAATLAAILGLGFAETASAQYVQQYTTITPRGGVATGGYLYNPGSVQSYNTYVSPFGTVRQRSTYGDVFGNNYGVSNGYHAFSGLGYNSSFYLPAPFVYPTPYPARGYSYNLYRRW
jgi:hypothetical protein